MDSLLVDLDKVLDDLEAEENNDTPVLPPGHEIKPSGYEDYLEQHSEKPWKLISEAPYQQGEIQYDPIKPPDKNVMNIMYDDPYEPTEKFDLSEADFAPSPTAGKKDFTESMNIYDISKGSENGAPLNSDSVNLGLNKNLLNEYDLSKPGTDAFKSNFVKNNLHSDNYSLPVQAADLSPDDVHTPQMNGHATDSDLYLPKRDNNATKKEEPVIQPLTLSSFSSPSSDKTVSDSDKAPVQCNTPSTPYENVYVNPFDSQLRLKVSEIPEPASSLEVHGAGSIISSHSDSQSDKNIDIQNQMLSQNQSLSNNEMYLNSYTSLPVENVQPNPASQFHSLPPTLGLQSHMQGLNQNDYKETVENKLKDVTENSCEEINIDSNTVQNRDFVPEKSVNLSIDAQQVPVNVNQQTDQNAVTTSKENEHTVYPGYTHLPKEPELQDLKVCGFNDEVELNENELDDYLGEEEQELTADSAPVQAFNPQNSFETSSVEPCAMDTKTPEKLKNVTDLQNSIESNNILNETEVTSVKPEGLDSIGNQATQPGGLKDKEQVKVFVYNAVVENYPTALEIKPNVMPDIDQPDQKSVLAPTETPSLVSESMESAQEIVIPSLDTGNIVTDSGAILDDDSNMSSGTLVDMLDLDIKPSENREQIDQMNSQAGLSVLNLNLEPPFVENEGGKSVIGQVVNENQEPSSLNERLGIDSSGFTNIVTQNEGRQLMDTGDLQQQSKSDDVNSASECGIRQVEDTNNTALEEETVELRHTDLQMPQNGATARPQSWGPSDSGQGQLLKQKRPTSLNLPPRPEFNPQGDGSEDESPEDTGASGDNAPNDTSYADEEMAGAVGGAEGPAIPSQPPGFDPGPPPPYSSTLGKVAPKWVPDAEAPACMNCEAKFTFTKRRHHCRACGKVFCSQCCSMKNRLAHMENKEGRVCFQCHQLLIQAEHWNAGSSPGHHPHPNNPTDYCSTVPPSQQAAGGLSPPSVLVPVTGVLKRDDEQNRLLRDGGHRRSAEPKQVMFSDGIRPGGDLTELDGSAEVTRMPPRRSRVQKKVERHSQDGHHSPRSRRIRTVADRTSRCLIPDSGLPPLVLSTDPEAGYNLMPNPQPDDFMQQVRDEEASPVIFAITPNLHVLVKIINLDCCVNHVVWCFTTQGMCTVGQEEIVTALEVSPEENTVPRDIFTHLYNVYEEAGKGNVVTELGHTIFNQSFLGSRDHGGFLYVRPTFQCVQKFVMPQPPYLFAILLQKWETPWAKVFPVRLMLRLGAEYRYYPCPLIGVRNRKPVYYEIGHTIMNLLADFRNYQYMLPQINGITIHMEDKVTRINFPRNRYDELMKVVNNSNEHVMAVGATFSTEADSHLVCIQNDDGNYQTQAINIQNKPRKVTGASFVVFNGALKTSSGLSAKSSIVEDGLMVQITPDSMLALKQAMKDMQNYTISCGSVSAPKPDETVQVKWVEDDRNVNIGVKSPIDNMSMDGIDSLHIYSSPDYAGENQLIRWTEVFFIENDDSGSVKWDPVDLSRLGETLATACCMALIPHLGKLKEAALTRIGLRVTIKPDTVGYEAGAGGERLPDVYMNDLDNELIPVMHRATQQNHVGTVLELIFQILN